MKYITAQDLQGASTDASTLEKFVNGPLGEPNVNRVGNDVSNLETLRGEVLEVAAGAARMVTYLTQADMYADLAQPVPTVGQVTNDPNPALNGYYVWNGTAWLWSGLQPPSAAQLDQVAADALAVGVSARGLWPYPWRVADGAGNMLAYVDGRAGVFRTLTDQLPGLPYLGAVYRYLVQVAGRAAFGVTHRGGFVAGGEQLLDGDYRLTWSQGGRIVMGQRHDGSLDMGTGLRGRSRVYTKGVEGARQIYAWNERLGELQITDNVYDNWAPELVQGEVQWLTDAFGSIALRRRQVVPGGPFGPEIARVVFALASGQSLAIGAATVPMTVTPPAPDRLVTFNHGVRRDGDLSTVPIRPWEVEWLVPGASNIAEVPLIQQSATALLGTVRYDDDVAIIAGEYGKGGTSITELGKGSTPYQNGITAAQRAKQLCDEAGLEVVCPVATWIQGEADRDMPAGEYSMWMLDLQPNYDTDLRAIFTAQVSPILVLLDQISSWTAYGSTESLVPFEQLQLALDHPDQFLCAGPKYHLLHADDGVHMRSESSRRLGAKFSEAMIAAYRGEAWLPTHATGAELSGTVVTITFHTPHAPLVADTVNVLDPGDLGLRWIDAGDGNAVSITSVVVNIDNTVSVALSGVPTGTGQMIGIADIGTAGASGGPTTGPRSCLRDSSPYVDLQGHPIFNWACHQRVPVTVI